MSFIDGYNIDELDAPKFISRGEWALTGIKGCPAYTPLKEVQALASGQGGYVTGIFEVLKYALPYDDPSGVSGSIGVTLRKMWPISDTGNTRNENILRRKAAVMHEGYLPLTYVSGTLDGTVRTMRYGDRIAAHPSGFRAWEELNYATITYVNDTLVIVTGLDASLSGGTGMVWQSGASETTVNVMNTGLRQPIFGYWADMASNLTGFKFRVKICPTTIQAVRP